MSRDTLILLAFCVFALLVGMRIKQRFRAWRNRNVPHPIFKNQRPRMARPEEPPEVRARRLRREQRVRFFTIAQLFVLGGLMVYMLPALVQDFAVPGRVSASHLFLRCLIFVFTIYIFLLGYFKVVKRRDKENMD